MSRATEWIDWLRQIQDSYTQAKAARPRWEVKLSANCVFQVSVNDKGLGMISYSAGLTSVALKPETMCAMARFILDTFDEPRSAHEKAAREAERIAHEDATEVSPSQARTPLMGPPLP